MIKLDIQITSKPTYLEEHSSPDQNLFIWVYEITILNNSDQIVQLLNRNWKITDLYGHVEEVHGPGVIGLQPIIKPKQSFSYSSFCQLATPQGTMHGVYEMQTLEEERFEVEIPEFALVSPLVPQEKLH